MLRSSMVRSLSIVLGMLLASVSMNNLGGPSCRGSSSRACAAEPGSDVDQLKAEIERLKGEVLQSAAMSQVDYHAQNLWFAGKAGNWPLAEYYWKHTQTHMRAGIELNRALKDNTGRQAKLDEVLKGIEDSPSMNLSRAIQAKDVVKFQADYRALLEGCYSCHKAIGKPFLRSRMPVPPAQSIITVDPNASWPK